MRRTIVICGYGPGISEAVARRFGRENLSVALVARNAERLSTAVAALTSTGVTAKAFPCDLGDSNAVRAMVRDVRASLGPIQVLHYNAYLGKAGDLTTAPVDDLRAELNVAVHGLVAATQEALPDLKAEKGAILVTGGSFAFYDRKVDAMAAEFGAMLIAVGKAAQHKTVGLLAAKLAGEGVYVGEVVVVGMVKGTAFDSTVPRGDRPEDRDRHRAGDATLDATAIAERFWDLYQRRAETSVNFG
jgi:NADP-dependent 3-hydroxy acid dehydrogenase YdfG